MLGGLIGPDAIDSPNTTSAVEYKLQLKEVNRVLLSHSGDTSVTLMEIKG